jgi:hypothetical protein
MEFFGDFFDAKPATGKCLMNMYRNELTDGAWLNGLNDKDVELDNPNQTPKSISTVIL